MERRYRTGDQMLVREMNLSTVLRCLHERAPLSRAALAGLTGLNKTTVSSLVEELLHRGLVREIGLDSSSGGRPATLLTLSSEAGFIIGVALGVDFVSVIVTDFVGQARWRRLQMTDPTAGQEAIIQLALQIVDEAIAFSQSNQTRLLGLGVATPGIVKVPDGLLIFSPNLQWRHVPLRQIFHQRTGLLVLVDNDANAAALAEHLFGVARQAHDFLSIFAGVGVGGGLFLNGQLYRGTGGFAGEVGHTHFMLEQSRRACRCGNQGCWETSIAQDSVIERVRTRLAAEPNSLVSRLMAEQDSPLTLSLIVQAADAGDTSAIEALTETGWLMGLGVANLVNTFNPEMVVLGGPLSTAARYLLPVVEEVVQKTTMSEIGRRVRILSSAFGADASLMGAAALVVETILSNPSSVECPAPDSVNPGKGVRRPIERNF